MFPAILPSRSRNNQWRAFPTSGFVCWITTGLPSYAGLLFTLLFTLPENTEYTRVCRMTPSSNIGAVTSDEIHAKFNRFSTLPFRRRAARCRTGSPPCTRFYSQRKTSAVRFQSVDFVTGWQGGLKTWLPRHYRSRSVFLTLILRHRTPSLYCIEGDSYAVCVICMCVYVDV